MSEITPPAPNAYDTELMALWERHCEIDVLLMEAMLLRKAGGKLIDQVNMLDRAAVAMNDNKVALQAFRNSIIVPDGPKPNRDTTL